MKITNAKSLPKVYYGMHMAPGVAEYTTRDREAYRILINEATIKAMDPSFVGKPVYVNHVDVVDLHNIQAEADGYVMESFFNQMDGKHWVKFIVVSDEGQEAIQRGYRLSNAYFPKSFSGGGQWHGVSYTKEVTGGEYEHLAIVKNPRYEESVIMTPEAFKAYNAAKESELLKLANEKTEGETKMAFSLWKKTKVEKLENVSDIESLTILLPQSKKEMTLGELAAAHDKVLNMHGYANGDHMVKVGEKDAEEEMSVNDLLKRHMDLQNEMKAMKEKDLALDEETVEVAKNSSDEEDEAAKAAAAAVEAEKKVADEKAAAALEEKKENAKAEADKKAEAKKKADALRNSQDRVMPEAKVDMSMDQVARGKARYGS